MLTQGLIGGVSQWWQLVFVLLVLVAWLVVPPLLLWVGAKYVAKLPNPSFGKSFLAMLLAGLAISLAAIFLGRIPLLSWIGALLLTWLIIMWLFKTSFGKAILAWLPTLAGLFLMGLLSIPTLGRSEQLARRVKCMSNLSSLGKACLLYMDDNNDQMPPDWDTLVKATGTDRHLLYCPSLEKRTKPYFYLAPPKDADPNTIVACEDANNHQNECINVLRLDGSTRKMTPEDFKAELAKPCNQSFAAALAGEEGRSAEHASALHAEPSPQDGVQRIAHTSSAPVTQPASSPAMPTSQP